MIVASVINGTVDNLDGQMFVGNTAGLNIKAILGVAAMSPFYFIGFDVIPQAAEEINVPFQRKSVKCLFYLYFSRCFLCTCNYRRRTCS